MQGLKCSHLSKFSVIALCPVLLNQAFNAGASEILINNREPMESGFISAPLVTIRPITTNKNSALLAKIRITKDLIVRSATAFPEVQTALEQHGVSDPAAMPMSDFVSVVRGSGYADRYLYGGHVEPAGQQYPVTRSAPALAQPQPSAWDARTLTNMVVTGVVDTDQTLYSTVDGNEVEWFRIDDRYARRVHDIYSRFSVFRADSSPNYTQTIFTSLRGDVTQYDALQRSMLENIGEITFGMPIVYTAPEKQLMIPASIHKSYDVYWIDLAVTYRGVDPGQLAEMALNVAVPEQSVALKLVPLRFGVEVSQSETEKTPDLGIEYGGAKITVGEYFSQTVAFRYLRPTIEAYGEGERRFSWRIMGEAMTGGSHRFAVIAGVPKGTEKIDLHSRAMCGCGRVSSGNGMMGSWSPGRTRGFCR